ncbi:MAG: Hsp20/alpha crystallin family protein [Desertifilum sp. SIO1I2]|nr:Hsp20/alpha crystallin family protein [Desertifilum sp. SIO1I2]
MKSFVYWQPWPEIQPLPSQLKPELHTSRTTSPRNTARPSVPAVEVQTTEEALILQVELPGVEARDIDLQVTRDRVAIAVSRSRQNQPQGVLYSEFQYGEFQRAIALSEPIVADRVQAKLNNGILTLTLPKLKAVQPEVVRVKLETTQNSVPSQPEVQRETVVSELSSPRQTNFSELEDPWVVPASA